MWRIANSQIWKLHIKVRRFSVKEHVRNVLRIRFEIHNTRITHNTFSLWDVVRTQNLVFIKFQALEVAWNTQECTLKSLLHDFQWSIIAFVCQLSELKNLAMVVTIIWGFHFSFELSLAVSDLVHEHWSRPSYLWACLYPSSQFTILPYELCEYKLNTP